MTRTAPAIPASMPDAAQAQRRTLRVLVASQVLSGAGLAAGVTVGALLAQNLLRSTSLAGLSSTLFTAGAALAAVAVGRLSQARGRRPGLAAGYITGAIGSAGVITAAVLGSPVLLFIALFVYGAGSATNLQARYAGADLADPDHRARAVSVVLVSTTLGGVAGPNLAAPAGALAEALGIPRLAGPFLVAGAAYALAALVLTTLLRPDPLLVARALADSRESGASAGPAADALVPNGRAGVILGAFIMVLSQLVMVAIMTMTPVHMHDEGDGATAFGLVIAIHIGAMYLPSPLTGWLVDRYGSVKIATASGITLLAAGVLAASSPASSVVLLALALALLGLGWNFGLVSGTAIITEAVPLAARAKTQGMVDVSIAIAGAVGGTASGFVVATAGYPVLALASGLISLAILPVIAITGAVRNFAGGQLPQARSRGAPQRGGRCCPSGAAGTGVQRCRAWRTSSARESSPAVRYGSRPERSGSGQLHAATAAPSTTMAQPTRAVHLDTGASRAPTGTGDRKMAARSISASARQVSPDTMTWAAIATFLSARLASSFHLWVYRLNALGMHASAADSDMPNGDHVRPGKALAGPGGPRVTSGRYSPRAQRYAQSAKSPAPGRPRRQRRRHRAARSRAGRSRPAQNGTLGAEH